MACEVVTRKWAIMEILSARVARERGLFLWVNMFNVLLSAPAEYLLNSSFLESWLLHKPGGCSCISMKPLARVYSTIFSEIFRDLKRSPSAVCHREAMPKPLAQPRYFTSRVCILGAPPVTLIQDVFKRSCMDVQQPGLHVCEHTKHLILISSFQLFHIKLY